MALAARVDGIDATGRRIAPVLARWRHALGWTQDELAARSGISRGYLSRLERGVPGRPGLDVLTRVCGAMGRTWADLFNEAGLSLPGDITLDDMRDGLHDPELIIYLRRLPELDERDRAVLRALLRAFFERNAAEQSVERASSLQLALPGTVR
ncbi:MAG TPA: helix-turn-helix domain-containing protein [Thermomicrobiales bacterium]|nr:helix-turn-helix domain-containing protein [Thermomicrobiales bacterium]